MLDHTRNLRAIKTFGFLLAVFGCAFSNSICGIGLGTYFGAFALGLVFSKETRPAYPAWRLLIALLLSLLVSVAISDYLVISLKGFGKYLQGFLLLYAGLDVLRTEKDNKAFIFTLAAGYLLALSSGVYQEIYGVDFIRGHAINPYRDDITRLTGTFKHCNDFGTFLVPGFAFALALLWDSARQKKWLWSLFWLALFAALSWALVRTISRGAIIAAFASLFFFILFFRGRGWALLGLAAALIVLWFVPSPVRERLHELPSLRAGDMSERVLLLKTSLRMVAENPVFGLGLNTYSDYFPKFKPADYPALMYTHNSYLQMAAESGLLGLGLYLLFLAVVIGRCIKDLLRRAMDLPKVLGLALVAGVGGILVNCLFESALQSTQLRTLFWALLGVAVALSRLKTR